jgi:hypothetical protein
MAYVAEGLGFIGKRATERQRGVKKEVAVDDICRDTGCPDVSSSCLVCPLPRCLFELPPAQRPEFLARHLPGYRKPGRGPR